MASKLPRMQVSDWPDDGTPACAWAARMYFNQWSEDLIVATKHGECYPYMRGHAHRLATHLRTLVAAWHGEWTERFLGTQPTNPLTGAPVSGISK
jgi:hypothetical protein